MRFRGRFLLLVPVMTATFAREFVSSGLMSWASAPSLDVSYAIGAERRTRLLSVI